MIDLGEGLIFNIPDRERGKDRCLYCGSKDPCRVDRDMGFCNLYPLGDEAPCVTGKPVGADDALVEQMARAMAIADTGARKWLGISEHWREYAGEARKFVAAWRVFTALA